MTFGLQRLPTEIVFGDGALAALGRTVAALGRRPVVVVDSYIATTPAFAGAMADLERHGLTVTVISDFPAELPVTAVDAAADAARGADPDVIVGFGGGSALDLAKLVALLLSHPGPLALYYGENAVPGPVLPIVAVPTTAGTGSEVTPVAVVSDPDRALKVGVSDAHLIPRAALVDPALSAGAPPAVTAYAGADALVHAMESLTAADQTRPNWSHRQGIFVGRNRFGSLLALDAAAAIGPALPTAVADGGNLAAREQMAWGSLLAGMAFGSAGTHLAHALQYPIGALTRTPHGLGTGMLMPYVLQACRDAVLAPLAQVAEVWGIDGGGLLGSAQATIDRTADVAQAIGLPLSLAEIGIMRTDLPRIAVLAAGVTRLVDNSPIPTTTELLERILEAAFVGDRSVLTNAASR